MSYLISLAIGLFVGVIYGALDFRSPAPPAIALVGLMGMLLGVSSINANDEVCDLARLRRREEYARKEKRTMREGG